MIAVKARSLLELKVGVKSSRMLQRSPHRWKVLQRSFVVLYYSFGM